MMRPTTAPHHDRPPVTLAAMILYLMLFVIGTRASAQSAILYEAEDIGADRWQYTYTLNNTLSTPIEEFTIWFDADLYTELVVMTPEPLSLQWDEQLFQPVPGLDDGGYDALALFDPLAPGESLPGFSVAFRYLGGTTPGTQPFDILDPDTLAVLHSGTTAVPEPLTALLLASALPILANKRPRRTRRQKPPTAN